MIINYYILHISIYRDKGTRLMNLRVINNRGLKCCKVYSAEIFLLSIKTQFRFMESSRPRLSGLLVCSVYSNIQIRSDKVFLQEIN